MQRGDSKLAFEPSLFCSGELYGAAWGWRRQHYRPDQLARRQQHVWKDKKDGGTLYLHLRHSGKKYNRRKGKNSGRGLIPNRVDIDQRPPIVAAKSRIGDWEADTIIGAQSQRRCHVACRASLQIHQARQTAGQERELCRAGLRTRAFATR